MIKNVIPKHWQLKKLGEVCNVLDNLRKPINSTERQQRVSGKKVKELYPYFGATGQVGWIDDYLTDGDYILVGEDGAPFLDLYKDKAYKIRGKSWVNNHAHILEGKKNIIVNDFILYYLNSIDYGKFVNGTTRLKLTKSNLVDIPLVVPPLPEQLAIVSKIEELLSDLDNSKQQLQTAQQQLIVYRQSLFKWAFEGKLTNNNVKEGELPKGWKIGKITDIVDINKHSLKAGPFGSSLKKEFYVKNGYKIYGQEQVISDDAFLGDYFINEEKYQELKSCKIKPLDILISLVGTVGKVLILPENCLEGVINPRLIKISLNKEKYLHKFFKYYFESSYVRNFYGSKAQGTTMDVLNLGIIKTIPFPCPSIKEQKLIVDELESKLTVCDKIEETISQSLQQAETLRQSILKKAFEGKLVKIETQNHV
jgi:type I restriction enzyme, S subunit